MNDTEANVSANGEGQGEDALAPLPPLWRRVVDVFVSPGELFSALAKQPKWFAAILFGGVLMGLATWLVPAEVYESSMRALLLERGMEVPDNAAQTAAFQRLGGTILSPVLFLVFSAALAGISTVIFAFVLGDRGTFKQYMAGAAHAGIITAVGLLVTTPLRINAGDPQFAISLGSMLAGIIPDGYFLNVLKTQQVFGIWATFVFAIAATRIDSRRGLVSAFAILMVVGLGFGMLGAFAM